jgi:hypothetical protein
MSTSGWLRLFHQLTAAGLLKSKAPVILFPCHPPALTTAPLLFSTK